MRQSFPTGVHIAQYLGDLSEGVAGASAGWAGLGAYFMASASFALTVASQSCYINPGWYPTLIFLGLESLSLWVW